MPQDSSNYPGNALLHDFDFIFLKFRYRIIWQHRLAAWCGAYRPFVCYSTLFQVCVSQVFLRFIRVFQCDWVSTSSNSVSVILVAGNKVIIMLLCRRYCAVQLCKREQAKSALLRPLPASLIGECSRLTWLVLMI